MLEKIKLLLGITDESKDDLLNELIYLCSSPILNYINEDDIPSKLNSCLIEFVIVRYNRLNSEGYNSESIDGASVNYVDNYFETIRGQLDSYIDNRENIKKKRIKFF